MEQDKRRKVVASAEEVALARKAEAMLKTGNKDFEKTYGSKTPQSFDVGADMAAMKEVGMMNQEQEEKVKTAQETSSQHQPAEVPSAAPQAAQEQPNPTPGMELSDDPEKRTGQIVEALKKIHPNPPTADVLKQWKAMHGDVFFLNIEKYVFIFRYLKRQEWIQINANPNLEDMKEHQVDDMMFNKCLLWPPMDDIHKAGGPAGAIPMVVQQIRLQSLFLDPSYVAQLTFKL